MARRQNNGRGLLKIETGTRAAFPGDLPKIKNTYDVLEVVGRGSLGVVHRAIHRKNDCQVALKMTHFSTKEVTAVAEAEFSILKLISHPNIVRALDFLIMEDDRAVLVMSFFDGKDLGTAVRCVEEQRLQEATARRLSLLLLLALEHLHERDIVHCDVKPGNVMLSHDFTDLCLIDFNIALFCPEENNSAHLCSQAYAAPEVCEGHVPTHVTDIWGAGLCLLMMLSGECTDQYGDFQEFLSDLPTVSAACSDALGQCLQRDPVARPTATTLLQSRWLQCGVKCDYSSEASVSTSASTPQRAKPCNFGE